MKLSAVENYEDTLRLIEQAAESESVSKQTLVDEFDQFLQTLGYGFFTDSELFAIEPAEMLQYAKLFLSSRKMSEEFRQNPSRYFHVLIERFLDSDINQEHYDSLTASAQNYLLLTAPDDGSKSISYLRVWEPDIHLRILSKLESHPNQPLRFNPDTYTYSKDTEELQLQMQRLSERLPSYFSEIEKNAQSPQVVERLDLALPSDEFFSLMLDDRVSRILRAFENLAEILMLWKVLYSEKSVIEVLSRFKGEPVYWTNHDLMDLLDDWEDLRDYPNEWILETRSKTRE